VGTSFLHIPSLTVTVVNTAAAAAAAAAAGDSSDNRNGNEETALLFRVDELLLSSTAFFPLMLSSYPSPMAGVPSSLSHDSIASYSFIAHPDIEISPLQAGYRAVLGRSHSAGSSPPSSPLRGSIRASAAGKRDTVWIANANTDAEGFGKLIHR
jgi:hypothetical protein